MTRIVCISDTHNLQGKITVPDGDILVHAGDIGAESHVSAVANLDYWFGQLPHKHKIIIPGNHDFWIRDHQQYVVDSMQHATMLIDKEITVEGLKFWGSPWQPWFHDWAWNLPRGKALEQVWSLIPDDTDVLITHGPPRNILDKVRYGGNEGCDDLRKRVFEVKPKLHVFGHIHEGYGQEEIDGIQFVNASAWMHFNGTMKPPIVVDV